MPDDHELLNAWRDGDPDAGNRLLRQHFTSLHRFFASKVGDEAEDLIQNTLLACVKYTDRLAAASSFKAYLFTIASNELYAHLRRSIREGELIDFTQKSAVDLGLSPSAVTAKRERDQLLSAALQRLPFELQIVLELGYWEGLATREIAEVLGVPLGTAKSKVRRAKQLLAAELEQLTVADPSAGRDRNRDPSPERAESEEADDLGDWVRQIRAALATTDSSPGSS